MVNATVPDALSVVGVGPKLKAERASSLMENELKLMPTLPVFESVTVTVLVCPPVRLPNSTAAALAERNDWAWCDGVLPTQPVVVAMVSVAHASLHSIFKFLTFQARS
jgi:hypothetical protein